jgi:phage baseplate assembly protein W
MVVKTVRSPDYSDLDLDFFAHPTTKDVVKKKGVEAIKRSIRNLVMLNFYDKKFQSWIASGATKMLFENPNPMVATFLQDAIVNVIESYEPRAQLLDGGVRVTVDFDNNGYVATIEFIERNTGAPVVMNMFLERLR